MLTYSPSQIYMQPPLFILGCPRSGTTFLSSLLKQSSYGSPFETHFIIKYFRKMEQYGDLNKYENFSKLVEDILSERAVLQHKLYIDIYKMFSKMNEKNYPVIINDICFKIAYNLNKHVTSWGDKTPFYTLHVDVLLKLFPKSRMIYITRDGRDVALSLMKRPWGPSNVYSCAKLWKNYMGKKQTLNALRNAGKVLEVKYEKILKGPEQEISKIYKFLDEEFSKQDIQQIIKGTKRSNYNKWEKGMKEKDIKIFENVAANTLDAEGYETRYKEEKINLGRALCYQLHDEIKRVSHLIKINTIDTIAIKFFNKEPFNG